MKNSLPVFLLLLCLSPGIFAVPVKTRIHKNILIHHQSTKIKLQTIEVKGFVRDGSGQPIPGVTVTLKGSSNATQTDFNGSFIINANPGDVLIFTYVGFIRKEAIISGASMNVVLSEDAKVLSDVVVTALGIKKERRSLGYSVTEIKGAELTEARENNVVNSLEGKVAGLNISGVAGGPGASSNVTIRGVSSLTQSSQPLYVVNGIPMESQPNGNPGSQYDNAPDLGDAIGNLNPDDIETISVLKGAAASALYGYRAKAGVILITTKLAKRDEVEVNSNYVGETIIDPTNWQTQYGQGSNNIKPISQLFAFQSGQSSYGAKLDGSSVVQFDGVSRPYVDHNKNLENFYRTGGTLTNTIAFNKVFDGGSIRFSANDVHNTSVVPNSGLNRQSFDLNGNYNISKHFVVNARVNYILDQAHNRPFLSDGPGNANYNVMFLPTSVDVNTLKKASNSDGTEYAYTNNAYATNPWFAANNFINNTSRTRLLSNASLRYNFDDGTFIQGRAGRDSYNDRYTAVVPTGTAYRPQGSIQEQSTNFSDLNVDVLAGRTFKAGSDLTITPNLGASYRRTKSEQIFNTGDHFAVPFVYNLLNATQNKNVTYVPSDQEVQSTYGTLELAYKNWLYLTGSLRSDWFSTLATPGVNNKLNVVYPSVSGSFVFSELLNADWLSLGKLRVGYAFVGKATDPNLTALSYNFVGPTLNGLPLGMISNTEVPNSSLKASLASEIELGTQLAFLKNRLNLDFAWYDKKSKDEIVNAPASISSGYTGAVLNIGELQNKGIETLISGVPFRTKNFNWTVTLNASYNESKVISLAPNASTLILGSSRTGNGFVGDLPGYAAGQVLAFDYKYDATGKIALDPNTGLPLQGDLKPFGSAYAKWIGGLTNNFTYKGFNFSFLIDGKFGGKIFSASDYYGYIFGLHKATLVNREGNFGTTANPIDAATYYSSLANNVSKLFVLDASFIKLRQVSFGYTIPGKAFNNVIHGATISLVARNLFYISKKTDNIDPEANYTSGLANGLELGGVPSTRTYGLNLNVKF